MEKEGSSLLGCSRKGFTEKVALEPSFRAGLGISQEDVVRGIFLGRGTDGSEVLESRESRHVWKLYVLRYCWNLNLNSEGLPVRGQRCHEVLLDR